MSDPSQVETDSQSYEGPDVETPVPDDDGNVAPAGGDEQTEAEMTADNPVEQDTIEALKDDASSA